MNDKECMSRALEMATRAVANGNHPFGAVLLINGAIKLVVENTVLTEDDVTRHAEMNLVSQACKQFSEEERKRAVLYTSTEPCAMCSGAIYWAGIGEVVFGCPAHRLDEIAGASLACHSHDVFLDAVNPPTVRGPVLEAEAAAQHVAYWPSPDSS